MCLSYISLLHLNPVRCFRVRGRYDGDDHVSHEFDAVVCGITVENAAFGLSLIGHPCISP